MQTARLVQAVVLMMIVAVAASCSAGKEYAGKLFAPRTPAITDSQEVVVKLRFLDLDEAELDKSNWVTTDIITGRDTTNQTAVLDKFSEVFPASPAFKMEEIIAVNPVIKKDSTVTKNTNAKSNATKPLSTTSDAKPVPVESEPVARTINSDEVRTKRTREK